MQARLVASSKIRLAIKCMQVPSVLNYHSNRNTDTRSIVVVRLARPILVDFWQAITNVHFLFLRFAAGIEIRALGLRCDTHCMSAVRSKAVGCRVVLCALAFMEKREGKLYSRKYDCPKKQHHSSATEIEHESPGS